MWTHIQNENGHGQRTNAGIQSIQLDGFLSQVTRGWGGARPRVLLTIFVTNHANKFDLCHSTILDRVGPNFFTLPRTLATHNITLHDALHLVFI